MRTASMWGAPAPVGPVLWDSNGNLSHYNTVSRGAAYTSCCIPCLGCDDIIHMGSPALCGPVLWDSSGNLS